LKVKESIYVSLECKALGEISYCIWRAPYIHEYPSESGLLWVGLHVAFFLKEKMVLREGG